MARNCYYDRASYVVSHSAQPSTLMSQTCFPLWRDSVWGLAQYPAQGEHSKACCMRKWLERSALDPAGERERGDDHVHTIPTHWLSAFASFYVPFISHLWRHMCVQDVMGSHFGNNRFWPYFLTQHDTD